MFRVSNFVLRVLNFDISKRTISFSVTFVNYFWDVTLEYCKKSIWSRGVRPVGEPLPRRYGLFGSFDILSRSGIDLDKKEKKTQVRCKHLWKTSVINWDGSVLPCCAVYGERHAFGNVFKEPFASIWNNEKYRLARREVRDKIKKSPTICHICKENGFPNF